MKRLISTAAAAAILFGTTAAFASPESDFEAAMNRPITSANAKASMSFTVDRLGEGLMADIPEDVDIKDMTIDMTMDMALKTSDDNMVMQSKTSTTAEVVAADEKISQDMWLDMDLRDSAHPVYRQIAALPDEDGEPYYEVTDMASLVTSDFIALMQSSKNNPVNIDLAGKTPVYKNGKYTVSLSDEEVYTTLDEAMGLYRQMMTQLYSDAVEGTDGEASIMPVLDLGFPKVKLFRKDAITLTVGLTEDKQYIHDMDMTIKLDTNVYDLVTAAAQAAGESDEDIQAELEGLTKENSDFACTIKVNMVYSDINKDIKIEFPVLTEENSYTVVFPSYTKLDVPTDSRGIDHELIPFVQLRGLCNAVGISDEDITWDNGKVTIKDLYGGTAVLTIDSTEVEYTLDGEKDIIELDYAPYIKDDFTYVDRSFCRIISETILVNLEPDDEISVEWLN